MLLTDSWFRWVYHFLGASRTFSNFKYIVHMSLNFDDYKESPKRKKSLGVLIGIGAIIGVIALGSTLAANINLNTGKPIEFGQGISQTVACSGDTPIMLTPQSTFINLPAGNFTATTSVADQVGDGNQVRGGTFYFNFGISNAINVTPGMKVSGVGIDPDTYVDFAYKHDYTDDGQTIWLSKELTGEFIKGEEVTFSGGGHYVMSSISVTNVPDACDGVNFTFKAYGNTGQLSHLVVGDCFNPYQSSGWDGRSIQATYDSSNLHSQLIGNTDQADTGISQEGGGFKLTFGGYSSDGYCMGAPSNDVYKITIESSSPSGGPLGFGLAFFTNQVFVSSETASGFTVGEYISSPTYPDGLQIMSITAHTLNVSDPDGQRGSPLTCASTNNFMETSYSGANCQGFHFGEAGYIITLDGSPYNVDIVEHLYPTPP